MSSMTSKPTLYDRLGGVYSIAAVVDDFIDRVMHNPVLNANAAVDEAHHRVSAAGFKYYVTEMVCWATGECSRVEIGGVGTAVVLSRDSGNDLALLQAKTQAGLELEPLKVRSKCKRLPTTATFSA
jgi:hypothetical protein